MKQLSASLWTAAAATAFAAYVVGRRGRVREPALMVVLLVLAAVFALLAWLASVAARRRRIAERLGVAPPRSRGRPDEDLGA